MITENYKQPNSVEVNALIVPNCPTYGMRCGQYVRWVTLLFNMYSNHYDVT